MRVDGWIRGLSFFFVGFWRILWLLILILAQIMFLLVARLKPFKAIIFN